MKSTRRRTALPIIAFGLLSACGGGDGSSVTTGPSGPSAQPTNHAPVFTSPIVATTPENKAGAVYQAVANDQDGDPLIYSIIGGADASHFTITPAGQLSFADAPDYELPSDANGDNIYEVSISVSDGKTTTTLALGVAVTNDKEGVAVHRVATGFIDPVAMTPLGDQTILVAEKKGAIWKLNPLTGEKTLVVRLGDVVDPGVLAIAAAPAQGPLAYYVMYMSTSGLVVRPNPNGLPGLESRAVFTVAAPRYPGGGSLNFDGRGELVVALSDSEDKAQDDASPLGKILHFAINPDPYAFPSSSYFLPPVTIAKGLRKVNGGMVIGPSLVIADSGESVAEEINLVPIGTSTANFGWPFKEGMQVIRDGGPADILDPVAVYPHTVGKAIIGGAVLFDGVPSLRGDYVFGDGSGAIFTVPVGVLQQGKIVDATALRRRTEDFVPDTSAIDHPVAFLWTPGSNGKLYILDADGEIFRVDAG